MISEHLAFKTTALIRALQILLSIHSQHIYDINDFKIFVTKHTYYSVISGKGKKKNAKMHVIFNSSCHTLAQTSTCDQMEGNSNHWFSGTGLVFS